MHYDDFQFIRFGRHADGVLLATLDRPDAMNATNARLHWELTQLWDVVGADDATKVLVVTGAGDRAFSAGGDLAWVAEMVGRPEVVAQVQQEASQIVYRMLGCDKPIVSAINGTAVGAGLAVALLADVSIMAEGARITDGHARLGVAAGDHAAMLWPLLCGVAKAKYYLMTADFIDGREAERLGLVTFCAPAPQVLPHALEVAARLARGSQAAIRATKQSINQWLRMAGPIFDHSLAQEMMGFLGPDAHEGLDALRARREPQFPSARLPGGGGP